MGTNLPRTTGRKRRLTLEQVLDEAFAMGIDNIEMAPLAKRLGVGVGTLYGYVNGRDHLIFQIASRQSDSATIKDIGQSWQDILREHAEMTFDRMRGWPQVISQLINGQAGTHFGRDTRRHTVAMLVARGLTAKIATEAYFETNQIVLGAVVVTQYIDSTVPEPLRGQGAEALGLPKGFGDYRPTLERMLTHLTEQLGNQARSA